MYPQICLANIYLKRVPTTFNEATKLIPIDGELMALTGKEKNSLLNIGSLSQSPTCYNAAYRKLHNINHISCHMMYILSVHSAASQSIAS